MATRGEQERTQLAVQQVSLSQGPLPPAEELAKYEEVCKGAADRIIKMAEGQSEHRKAIEKSVVDSANRRANRGLVFAFILALVVLVGGFALILNDYGAAGVGLIVGEAVALSSLFIYGKVDQRKERQQQLAQFVR